MRVHELQDLALGDRVGGIRHDFLDPKVAETDHHLEGARVQVIADQHACGITPDMVAGFAAATQVGSVHHIVVEQRRRVDELDHRGGLDVPIALVPAGACSEQHRERAQTLAAARHDVAGDLVDQRDVACEACDDHLVDAAQVVRDQCSDLVQWHLGGSPSNGAMVTA